MDEKEEKVIKEIGVKKKSRRWSKLVQNLNLLHILGIGLFLFIGYNLALQNIQNPRTIGFISAVFLLIIAFLLFKSVEIKEPIDFWEARAIVSKEVQEKQKLGIYPKGKFELYSTGDLPFSEGIGSNPVPTKHNVWFTITNNALSKYYCAKVDPHTGKILGIAFKPFGYEEKKDIVVKPLPEWIERKTEEEGKL